MAVTIACVARIQRRPVITRWETQQHKAPALLFHGLVPGELQEQTDMMVGRAGNADLLLEPVQMLPSIANPALNSLVFLH